MKFECPKCKKAGDIADSRIPETGLYATCPSCHLKFLLQPSKEFNYEPVQPPLQVTAAPTDAVIEVTPVGKPWRRFWARTFDNIVIVCLLLTITCLVIPQLPAKFAPYLEYPETWGLYYMFSILFIIVIEIIMLGIFNTTPGKWLLNIKISSTQGNLGMFQIIGRCFDVWIRGYALGTPVVSMIAMALAAGRIKRTGNAIWDDRNNTTVYCDKLHLEKVAIFCVLFVCGVAFETVVPQGAVQAYREAKREVMQEIAPAPAPAPAAPPAMPVTDPIYYASPAPIQLPAPSSQDPEYLKPVVGETIQDVAVKVYQIYPFLDKDSPYANRKAIETVIAKRDELVSQGYSQPEALRVAVFDVAPQYLTQ